MTAPVITDDMRAWASAYVAVCQAAAEQAGQPFDAIKAQWAIREALLNPPTLLDLDPDIDDHGGPVDNTTADRAAASNYPRGVLL